MDRPSVALLRRLAEARGIRFRPDRLPTSRWFTTSDGARLHYLDWPGGAEILVLLHGGALSAHTFDLVALALGDSVRCLALDLRGHGRSDWADAYPVDRSAADVADLAASLSLDRVNLAGMSLGGCIAGHAGPLLGAKLASLMFIDVGPKVNFAATARMRGFLEGLRPVSRVEDLALRALAVSPRTDPELMLYRYQSLLAPSPEGFVSRADRRRPVDFPHILDKLAELAGLAPKIACPVTVVKGARSAVLTISDLEAFAQAFPRGRAEVIPGAGHNVQEDAPAALAAELKVLLARARSPICSPPSSPGAP